MTETTEKVFRVSKTDPDEPDEGENFDHAAFLKSKREYLKEKLSRSVDAVLADLDDGIKVSINRTRPGWCDGWLETIEVAGDEDEQFSLEALRDTWGGGTFILRFHIDGDFVGSKQVKIAGPPRAEGNLLEHPDKVLEREKQKELAIATSQRIAAPQPQTNLNETLIATLIQANQAKDSDNFKFMREAMKTNTPQTKVSELKELSELMEILRASQPDENKGGGDEIAQMITGALELFKNQQNQQQLPTVRPAQVIRSTNPRGLHKAPTSQSLAAPIPKSGFPLPQETPVASPEAVPPSQNLQPVDEPELPSLAEELADMEPFEILQIVDQASSLMPPEKQEEIQNILKGLFGSPTTSNQADVNQQKENKDDPLKGGPNEVVPV